MKLDEATLDHIAGLARLDMSDPAEREAMLLDMQHVFNFVQALDAVDTSGVEPLIFMTDAQDVLREDVARMEITKKEALSNAPVKDSDYFKVPKVME